VPVMSKAAAKLLALAAVLKNLLFFLFSAAWRIAARPPFSPFECQPAYYMGVRRESFYPLHSNQMWLLFPKLESCRAKCLGCKKLAMNLVLLGSPIGTANRRFRVSNLFPTSDALYAFNGWVEKAL
jgi:hypothetical protein